MRKSAIRKLKAEAARYLGRPLRGVQQITSVTDMASGQPLVGYIPSERRRMKKAVLTARRNGLL